MAYEVIRTKEFDNPENDEPLKLLKYAILKNEDRYYVQLKLLNDSNFCISRFKFNYKTSEGRQVYTSPRVDADPDDIFFDKNLIEIPSESFSFLGFEKVYAAKEQDNKRDNKRVKVKKEKSKILQFFTENITGILSVLSVLVIFSMIPFFGRGFFDEPLIMGVILLVPLALLFMHLSNLEYKKLSDSEKKKKDLSPLLMWFVACLFLSLFSLLYIIIASHEDGVIPFIVLLLAAMALCIFYFVRRNKLKKNNNLIIRKNAFVHIIVAMLLVFTQSALSYYTTIDVLLNIIKPTVIDNGNEFAFDSNNNCFALKKVNPELKIVENIEWIDYAYSGKSVGVIYENAFSYSSCELLSLSQTIKIYNYAFEDCDNLKYIVALNPKSLELDEHTFDGIENLSFYFYFSMDESIGNNITGPGTTEGGYEIKPSDYNEHFKDSFKLYFASQWEWSMREDGEYYPLGYDQTFSFDN